MLSVRALLAMSVISFVVPTDGWRFKNLDLDEEQIEIARIAVHVTRAFLAIPRTHDDQPFTLVEVTWPEKSIYKIYNTTTKPFPSDKSQTIGDCKKVQSVVALDIDSKGRLYVLDKGYRELCPPKIVVYNLKTNEEILQTELTGVPAANLNALVIDSNPYSRDTRVILADAGNNSLLVFNLSHNNWWRLSITNPSGYENDERIDDEPENYFSFNQLAISQANATLYATFSERPELYAIDLRELRNVAEPTPPQSDSYEYKTTDISVHYVGDKFGKSKGLFVDAKGNVYYVYERDHVILKWNPSKPFVTENVNVVLQNYSQIPYPVQLFCEPSYQLWALNSKCNQHFSYVVKIKSSS